MTDDVSVILQEIAQLLRQRVEQTADMAKRAEERLARIPDSRTFAPPDFPAIEARHETEATARRDEAAQWRAEDVAFRERLIGATEDHNALIRALLDRVARSAAPYHDQPPDER